MAGLWLLTVNAARATDVVYFELFKGQHFTQSGTNSPALAANGPDLFQALVYPLGYPDLYLPYVTNPVVITPAGLSHALTLSSQTNANGSSPATNYVFSASAASLAALDASYGAGTYTLKYTGKDDGAASVPVSLGADAFPPAPFVSNLLAAQAVDASADFTLSWVAWPSADTNDFVQLTILDGNSNLVFATPPLFAVYPQSPLSATNTGTVISNGTLAAGQTYTATLAFTGLTTNNLYHFTGFPFILAGFFSQTTFNLQTRAPPPTNAPPPPASPTSLAGTVLTLTVTNATGPLASSGVFQLFTTPLGSNYFVLGNTGGGFGSGGYVYAQTGTNTATATLTDSEAGLVSLQVVFDSAGGGTFVISRSSGVQQGVFKSSPAYAPVNAPSIFLPSFTNGQFQAYMSGDPGVVYTVESSTDLRTWSTLTNVTIPNLTITLIDPEPSGARFYRAKVNSIAFAPSAITGQTLSSSIAAGSSPFSTNGIFQWAASTNGNDYQIIGGTGATNGSGTYAYSVTRPTTAGISYTDSSSGASRYAQLVFTSVSAGYYYTTNAGSAGFQSGSFNLASGPVLFLGNVKFTPDTARGASAFFPADGTPLSLSVTDAVGYVWSLNVPADALLTSATLSMTPFAAIDSSQSALPILSGVQLGPEGMQFCDGLTLTLTPPAPLGPNALLLMGAGDGTNLRLVQTTNQPTGYSTTILHFSSGAASDPSDPQSQDLLAEAQAACKQAESDLLNVQKQQAAPPEPPDDEAMCAGNPAADAQVDEYVFNLFSEENAVIANLLSAARTLQLLGDDSDAAPALALVEPFVSTECFRKINSLYNSWRGKPLKFSAYAKAALSISRQDQLLGGAGVPGLSEQLQSWLKGNVVAYYWNQLLNQHDYSMAPVLFGLERQFLLLGGSSQNDNFLQDVALGYTFDVTLTISDVGADNYAISAHGTVRVTGCTGVVGENGFTVINPIGDSTGKVGLSDNFSYDSGTYANDTLQLPLSFTEGAVFNLGCSNTTVALFIYGEMGSFNEFWNGPDFPAGDNPNNFLISAFDDAFENSYSTLNVLPRWDCDYVFPVQWQDMQAQPVHATFTGKGGYEVNEIVTFTIVVAHHPQSAPPTLTL